METTMRTESNIEAARMLFAAWQRWDLDTIESLVADDAVDGRPSPGSSSSAGRTSWGCTARCQARPESAGDGSEAGRRYGRPRGRRYGEGPVHLVGVVESRRKAISADYYFADPFDPPESRARWQGAGGSGR